MMRRSVEAGIQSLCFCSSVYLSPRFVASTLTAKHISSTDSNELIGHWIEPFIASVGYKVCLSPEKRVLSIRRSDRGVNDDGRSGLQYPRVLRRHAPLDQVNATDMAGRGPEEIATLFYMRIHGKHDIPDGLARFKDLQPLPDRVAADPVKFFQLCIRSGHIDRTDDLRPVALYPWRDLHHYAVSCFYATLRGRIREGQAVTVAGDIPA